MFFSLNSPFARGINKLVQMLYMGVLWFITSIPIITAGAATAALYEVLLKMEKNHEGYIGISFFRAFGKNFKSATALWLPILIAGVVFGVNLFYYGVLGEGHFPVQCAVFAIMLLLTVAVSGYVFPSIARFENTAVGTFRFAFVLAARNPGWTVAVIAIHLLTLFVCWFFLFFPVLFIMGISGYLQAVIMNHIFDRLIERGEIIETCERTNKE